MYTVGLTLRNNLHNCTSAWYKNWAPHALIRYYWNNVDVLIVACAIAESYAIIEDSKRQCPKPHKILNIRPEQPNICRTVITSARVSVLSP
jgi:hypothetical protein